MTKMLKKYKGFLNAYRKHRHVIHSVQSYTKEGKYNIVQDKIIIKVNKHLKLLYEWFPSIQKLERNKKGKRK